MTEQAVAFVVDDDEILRILLESVLSEQYQVECFESAEDCLARLAHRQPDIFLLDVRLPGMNGHDLCRLIRSRPDTEHLPVVFISTDDDLQTVLAGYDGGGDDYILKPFDVAVLKRKLERLHLRGRDQQALMAKASSSEELATLVMANLDENAGLITFLRSLNDCPAPRTVLGQLFDLLHGFSLRCVMQVRLPGLELTVGEEGENHPFETAVIRHIREMDRIFQFKSRAVYNFERITILINNMPMHDPELCGRIRDHVAIAAECADAKLLALITKAENAHSRSSAQQVLQELNEVLTKFDQDYRRARYQGSEMTQAMLDELARAFASLGLSEDQEARIDGIIRRNIQGLERVYDFSRETEKALSEIARGIARIMAPATPELEPDTHEEETADAPHRVELF